MGLRDNCSDDGEVDVTDVVTVREAAALLRVDRKTIITMIDAGSLPAARIGVRGEYRIRKTDIDALFRQQQKTAEG